MFVRESMSGIYGIHGNRSEQRFAEQGCVVVCRRAKTDLFLADLAVRWPGVRHMRAVDANQAAEHIVNLSCALGIQPYKAQVLSCLPNTIYQPHCSCVDLNQRNNHYEECVDTYVCCHCQCMAYLSVCVYASAVCSISRLWSSSTRIRRQQLAPNLIHAANRGCCHVAGDMAVQFWRQQGHLGSEDLVDRVPTGAQGARGLVQCPLTCAQCSARTCTCHSLPFCQPGCFNGRLYKPSHVSYEQVLSALWCILQLFWCISCCISGCML